MKLHIKFTYILMLKRYNPSIIPRLNKAIVEQNHTDIYEMAKRKVYGGGPNIPGASFSNLPGVF